MSEEFEEDIMFEAEDMAEDHEEAATSSQDEGETERRARYSPASEGKGTVDHRLRLGSCNHVPLHRASSGRKRQEQYDWTGHWILESD